MRRTLARTSGFADRVFTPGEQEYCQLQGSGEFNALLVDEKAVLTDQDRKYVYVLGEGNKAERRDVDLGTRIGGERVVRSGLKAGDRVIALGTGCGARSSPGSGHAIQVAIASGTASTATSAPRSMRRMRRRRGIVLIDAARSR